MLFHDLGIHQLNSYLEFTAAVFFLRYVAPHTKPNEKPFAVHHMKGLRDVSPPSKEIPGAVFIDDGGLPKSKSALKRAKRKENKENQKLQKKMEGLNVNNSNNQQSDVSKQSESKKNKKKESVKGAESSESPSVKPASTTYESPALLEHTPSEPVDTSWQTVSKGKSQAPASMTASVGAGKNIVVAPVTNVVKSKSEKKAANSAGSGPKKNPKKPNIVAPAEPETSEDVKKLVRKLKKKLGQIEKLEERVAKGETLNAEEKSKVATKVSVIAELAAYPDDA